MCLCGPADRASRRRLAIGLFCISIALGLQALDLHLGLSPALFSFVRGVLLGLGLALIFAVLLGVRRQQSCARNG